MLITFLFIITGNFIKISNKIQRIRKQEGRNTTTNTVRWWKIKYSEYSFMCFDIVWQYNKKGLISIIYVALKNLCIYIVYVSLSLIIQHLSFEFIGL